MLPKFKSAYVIMEPLNISDHYPVFAALHCDYPSFTPTPFYKWVIAGRPRNISHPAHKAYKDAKKHFRSCLRLHRKSHAENFFTSLDAQMSDPRRFFQSIRRHISFNFGTLTQRLIHEGKEYIHDSIREAWASYFESLATPVATPFLEEQLKILAAYHCSQSLPADEPDLVSEE